MDSNHYPPDETNDSQYFPTESSDILDYSHPVYQYPFPGAPPFPTGTQSMPLSSYDEHGNSVWTTYERPPNLFTNDQLYGQTGVSSEYGLQFYPEMQAQQYNDTGSLQPYSQVSQPMYLSNPEQSHYTLPSQTGYGSDVETQGRHRRIAPREPLNSTPDPTSASTDTHLSSDLHDDDADATPPNPTEAEVKTCEKDFFHCHSPNATIYSEQGIAAPNNVDDVHILLFKEILKMLGIREDWKVVAIDFPVKGGPSQKLVTSVGDQAVLAKYLRTVRTAIIAKHEDRDCAYWKTQKIRNNYKSPGGLAGDIVKHYKNLRKIPGASWKNDNRPLLLRG